MHKAVCRVMAFFARVFPLSLEVLQGSSEYGETQEFLCMVSTFSGF